MATSWHKADAEVTAVLDLMRREHHPRLTEAGVRVCVLMGFNPEGDAITHGGYPAAAKVKVVALKDRITKGYDAEMHIDERVWHELTDALRASLIDHELCHLDTVDLSPKELAAARENYGSNAPTWRTDDIGRPKLRSVPGDWNTGDGFKAVIARHGLNAIEYRNIAAAKQAADQARTAGEADRAADAA